MRHGKRTIKLGRKSEHRNAMLRECIGHPIGMFQGSILVPISRQFIFLLTRKLKHKCCRKTLFISAHLAL